MTKTKTFEAFTHDAKKPTWVVLPQDKGESYSKHVSKGNPIQVVWTQEDGTRKTHLIKNQDNLPLIAMGSIYRDEHGNVLDEAYSIA
tara:strand:- start:391 stop:651 length:261 start_codon:yes stop_codon:yes gene_type:complete